MHNRIHFDDDDSFSGAAYRVRQYPGVGFRLLGWETEPDDDTEWSGFEVRTGRVVAHMIGDDRLFSFDPDDCSPVEEGGVCWECGQLGCPHGATPTD